MRYDSLRGRAYPVDDDAFAFGLELMLDPGTHPRPSRGRALDRTSRLAGERRACRAAGCHPRAASRALPPAMRRARMGLDPPVPGLGRADGPARLHRSHPLGFARGDTYPGSRPGFLSDVHGALDTNSGRWPSSGVAACDRPALASRYTSLGMQIREGLKARRFARTDIAAASPKLSRAHRAARAR